MGISQYDACVGVMPISSAAVRSEFGRLGLSTGLIGKLATCSQEISAADGDPRSHLGSRFHPCLRCRTLPMQRHRMCSHLPSSLVTVLQLH